MVASTMSCLDAPAASSVASRLASVARVCSATVDPTPPAVATAQTVPSAVTAGTLPMAVPFARSGASPTAAAAASSASSSERSCAATCGFAS